MRLRIGIAVLGALASSLLATSSASAGYKLATTWGGVGSANGRFESPHGIAVSPANGDVYVADYGNHRVQEFTPSGSFVRKWKLHNDGEPDGIAISSGGNVYVTDHAANAVEKYTSSGSYLWHVTKADGDFSYPADAVSPGSGVWIDDHVTQPYSARIVQLDSNGSLVRDWLNVADAYGIGLDSYNGFDNVFVGSAGIVYVYSRTGDEFAGFLVEDQNGVGLTVRDVAVTDNPTRNVFVTVPGGVREYPTFGGSLIREIGLPERRPYRIAIAPNGSIYVTSNEHAATGNGTDEVLKFIPVRPQTTITSGPSGLWDSTTANFSYKSSESGSTFQCKLDSQSYKSCPASGKTYTGLAEGQHTFKVRATDIDSLTDATPATRTFTVDTTPPETTITSGPANGDVINDPTPTFKFTSSEAGSTFSCGIHGVYGPCTSPHTTASLPDGKWTFTVDAQDPAGNNDPTPASRTFTVDTTARVVIPSDPITLTPGGAADVSVRCPSSEPSGGCAGTLTLRTHNQVTFNGQTKKFTLGSANFIIPTGDTKILKVQLSSAMQQLVADNDPLATDAIADVQDALGNHGTTIQTFDLSAP
jgi:NHL repeat